MVVFNERRWFPSGGGRFWRRMVYQRSVLVARTRNVLIVGAGRVGHAYKEPYLCATTPLGFRFKGFVALSEREAESGDADVIGDVRNCLSLARSLFVDEIFLLGAGGEETWLLAWCVEEARVVINRRPCGAGYVRRVGVECEGWSASASFNDPACTGETSRSAGLLVKACSGHYGFFCGVVEGPGDAGDC